MNAFASDVECKAIWHFNFLELLKGGRRQETITHIAKAKLAMAVNEVIELRLEQGENLMMMKVFLQLVRDFDKELKLRRIIFITK